MLKQWKYILPTFQNKIQIMKNKSFLKIPNGEGWHYLAVKNLFALLRRIASKPDSDFYFFYCLEQKTNLNLIKGISKLRFLWYYIMPCKDTKFLEFNQHQKSGKTSSIIYSDL